jgi:hypothetical protein
VFEKRLTRKAAERAWANAGHSWNQFHNDIAKSNGAIGFLPGPLEHHLWSLPRAAVALFYLIQCEAGLTVKTAGRWATKLWEGVQMHPDQDQLTLLTLENGATSIHPAGSVDLASGYVGGGFIVTALTVDLRNLRDRLEKAVEQEAAIIGERDDA